MICNYALFCEDFSVDSSNRLSIERLVSSLELERPGSVKLTYIIGVSGTFTAKERRIRVIVTTPMNTTLSSTWECPSSNSDENVINGLFNCSNIPFEHEGLYHFDVKILDENGPSISSRSLRVSFGDKGGDI